MHHHVQCVFFFPLKHAQFSQILKSLRDRNVTQISDFGLRDTVERDQPFIKRQEIFLAQQAPMIIIVILKPRPNFYMRQQDLCSTGTKPNRSDPAPAPFLLHHLSLVFPPPTTSTNSLNPDPVANLTGTTNEPHICTRICLHVYTESEQKCRSNAIEQQKLAVDWNEGKMEELDNKR